MVSDLHVDHKKILEFCSTTRKFDSVDDMHHALITNWNAKVGENDTVYILGDLSFGKVSNLVSILEQLNGKEKHLIIGNHDVEHLRKQKLRDCFTTIEHYREIKHNGNKICLMHFPLLEWNGSRRGLASSYHLHGHLHSVNPEVLTCKRWDVGLDGSPDFAPYELDTLIQTIDSRLKI